VFDYEIITIDVRDCARCAGDHDALVFHPLINPPKGVSHYAMCSDTQQPILLTITIKDINPLR
jgi:hypothetical protein